MLEIEGQKPDPVIPPTTLYGLFHIVSAFHWDDVVVSEKELTYTCGDLKRDALTLAQALTELGIKEGDVVSTYTARSMYANIVFFFATNCMGAKACIHDERISQKTLLDYCDEFHSSVLITYQKSEKWINSVKRQSGALEHVINITASFDEKNFDESILETFYLDGERVTDIAAHSSKKFLVHILGSHLEALYSFTSGSTSGPKPMAFTNENLLAAAIISKEASDVQIHDEILHTWMSYVRLDCPYGLVVSVLAPICGGGEVITTPDINDQNLAYYFGKNPNTIFGIPLLLESLVKMLKSGFEMSGLKMFASGGERMDSQLWTEANETFRAHGLEVRIANGYGVGEALGMISTAVGNIANNPDSVGKIPAGVHVMIIDQELFEEQGIVRELGFDEEGLLCVTGKHILTRYVNRPDLDAKKSIHVEQTKFSLKFGQFSLNWNENVRFVVTGDRASVTKEGYITLIGRADFFINNRPEKVYCGRVRIAVEQSPLVNECYVVGGPDPELKNVAYAYVVPRDGVAGTATDRAKIIQDANKPFEINGIEFNLEPYELPKHIFFLKSLPMTTKDKIDLVKLGEFAENYAKVTYPEYV